MATKHGSLEDSATLREFVRRLREGIYITNLSGSILAANPALLEILGYSTLEALRAVRAEELWADPEERRREIRLLEQQGAVREFELELVRPDGSRRTVLDTCYEVTDPATGERHYHGILVDMGVSYRETLTDELMLNLGPGATWASDDYMETYFGISSAQSARSGYPAFDADAGFKDVSFGGALTYSPLPFLALTGFANYERLLGDAADSPLVRDGGSPNQVMVGVTMTLRFGFDEPW